MVLENCAVQETNSPGVRPPSPHQSTAAVHRLPDNVVSQILSHATRQLYLQPQTYSHFGIGTLTLVCRAWRRAALDTPHLWSLVRILSHVVYGITRDSSKESLKILEQILARSAGEDILIIGYFIRDRDQETPDPLADDRRLTLRMVGVLQVMRTIAQYIARCSVLHLQIDHHALAAPIMQALAPCMDKDTRLSSFLLLNAQRSYSANDRDDWCYKPLELTIPFENLTALTLGSIHLKWIDSFFGEVFSKVQLLRIIYPQTLSDPSRILKVPPFFEFEAAILALPALTTLELCRFGPNEHTFPKLNKDTYIWHQTLRFLKLTGFHPDYAAKLLTYFDLTTLRGVAVNIDPSARIQDITTVDESFTGLGPDDYEASKLMRTLRGDVLRREWQDVSKLEGLTLRGIDVPWYDLALTLSKMPALHTLTIPCSEVMALTIKPPDMSSSSLLPNLRSLTLESDSTHSSPDVVRFVRKALLLRAALVPTLLKTLLGPDWLIEALRTLGKHELYAFELRPSVSSPHL